MVAVYNYHKTRACQRRGRFPPELLLPPSAIAQWREGEGARRVRRPVDHPKKTPASRRTLVIGRPSRLPPVKLKVLCGGSTRVHNKFTECSRTCAGPSTSNRPPLHQRKLEALFAWLEASAPCMLGHECISDLSSSSCMPTMPASPPLPACLPLSPPFPPAPAPAPPSPSKINPFHPDG